MISGLKKYRYILVILIFHLGFANQANALDGQSASKNKVSMHEVAVQIRQFKSWQILDASPQKKKSGYQYFRFKLLHNNGKVKIINIDPNNPNLRTLE